MKPGIAGTPVYAPAFGRKIRRYALDNAAKLYPSVATKDWSNVYRILVTMRSPVNYQALQTAVDRVLPRFPIMSTRLRRGFFWYSLEENTAQFNIQKDTGLTCLRFNRHENNGYLFRVLYSGNNISIEFFHALTDGYGGFVFTKTVVAEYLRQCGFSVPNGEGILDINQAASSHELEDAFLQMPLPKGGFPPNGTKAYHLTGKTVRLYSMHVVAAYMSSTSVREKAKAIGITVTEYLAAAMLYVAISLQKKEHPQVFQPVRISLPVNMRKYFSTQTLRNFSYYVNPEISAEKASTKLSFEDIAQEVHSFMKKALVPEYLFDRISNNVASEKMLVVRAMPLFLKNMAIRSVFRATGDRLITTTLTNLGYVNLPDELSAHVEHFACVLGPPYPNPRFNASLATTGDIMTMMFSGNLEDDSFVTEIVRFLQGRNINISFCRIAGPVRECMK